MGPEQVPPLRVRVDQGVMAMKMYSTFPKAVGLEPQHQMQFSVISRALVDVGGPNSLQKYIFYSPTPIQRGGKIKKPVDIPWYKCE